MKRRKPELYILTLLLLAVVFLCSTLEQKEREAFSFQSGGETIQVWEESREECYVFLPGYVDLSQLTIQTPKPRRFGKLVMKDGMDCGGLELGRPYDLGGGATITFLKSENLPALFLDTASTKMDSIHADKTHREGGQIRLYDESGALDCRMDLDYIKGRGNSTFLYQDKKPYSLKLFSPRNLLGMGTADKWILLANAYDDSQLRNKIIYDFAARTGLGFAPESRFVDLYLNGEYAGLYQLCERNQIHEQRVNISKTDSFLVSVDRSWGSSDPLITTDAGITIRIHESDLPTDQVRDIWQQMEDAILAGEIPDRMDLDSWARKYLIEEVFSNTDGGRFSQFYYLSGGTIYAGPVWDYDLALSNPVTYREFGDVGYRDSRYNMLYVKTNPDSWFYYLYQNEQFQARVKEIYQQEVSPLLKDLNETVTALEVLTAPAARMNRIRWKTQDPAPEIQAIRDCIAGRREFLTSLWVENREYVSVMATYVDRNIEYFLTPGEPLTQLPNYPTRTWFYTGTEEAVDETSPVWEPKKIELRPNP